MREIRRLLNKNGCPVTYSLIAVSIVSLFLLFLSSGSKEPNETIEMLAFNPSEPLSKPWTWITYTLITGSLNALLCIGIGLFFFASAIEKRFGSYKFGIAFLVFTLLSPISIWLAFVLTGAAIPLYGMALPVSATIVSWAVLYPKSSVLFMMVLPVPGWFIGTVTFAGVLLGFGMGAPIAGFCACIPLFAGIIASVIRYRIPVPRSATAARQNLDYQGRNFEKSRQAELERLKLKELFERSWSSDDDDNSKK